MPTKKLSSIEDLENIRLKYSSVLTMKASEGEIQWSRYNAMLVANTIIIGLISFTYTKDSIFPLLLQIIFWFAPFLGILLCIVWHKMTERGFSWTKFWTDKAYDLEGCIKGTVNPIQDGRKKRDDMGAGYTKRVSLLIIDFFAVIYGIIFLNNILTSYTFLVFSTIR